MPIGDFEISYAIDATVEKDLTEGLVANAIAKKAPPYKETPLQIVRRDSAGRVVAGLIGKMFWGWLYIDSLWVEAPARGSGIGRALVSAAEAQARTQGCHDVFLWTQSYEGPTFYPKLGYQEFVVKQDFPTGFTRTGFMKRLAA